MISLRGYGVALLAGLVVAIAAAGSAQAWVWEAEGTKFAEGQSESLAMEKTGETAGSIKTVVLGTDVEIGFTGLSCVGCKIDQVGTGLFGQAHSTGKVKFTGVTVVKPTGCKIASTLETSSLTDEITTALGFIYDKFFPETGTTFLSYKIDSCPIAANYSITGTVTGFTSGGASLTVNQPIRFSATDQTNGGGALTLGTQKVTITSEATTRLSGGREGQKWRVVES